ncbi:MAG: hypothetical protein OXD43_05250 [Bacteroidetes bacterium]|nr:hypothetical protein [Bacteroidota bacterium]
MPYYIVNRNAQSNGDHEVHIIPTPGLYCRSPQYPHPANQVPLGHHGACHGAVWKAKSLGYSSANGCAFCSLPCHTG